MNKFWSDCLSDTNHSQCCFSIFHLLLQSNRNFRKAKTEPNLRFSCKNQGPYQRPNISACLYKHHELPFQLQFKIVHSSLRYSIISSSFCCWQVSFFHCGYGKSQCWNISSFYTKTFILLWSIIFSCLWCPFLLVILWFVIFNIVYLLV